MSQQSKLRQSREQWKQKAGSRAEKNHYQSKELTRVKTERDRFKKELKETRARLDQLELNTRVLVIQSKVDLVYLALQLFLVARIGFRAVSRVLGIVAQAFGIKKSSVPADRDQLGEQTLTGAHPICPDVGVSACGKGALLQRAPLDDRHEHCSGNG